MNSTGSVHVIQTPSRSFAGVPFTPPGGMTDAPLDFAQRMTGATTSLGHEFYSTPLKQRGFGTTPERLPPSTGAAHRRVTDGHPPAVPGSASPGLSPIVKTRGSGARKHGDPFRDRHRNTSLVDSDISYTADGVAPAEKAANSFRGLERAVIAMPHLSDADDATRPASRSMSVGSGVGGSDDGSESIPPYGYMHETVSVTSAVAFTPPRSEKPITPAPRSLSSTTDKQQSVWPEGETYMSLNYGTIDELHDGVPSEDLSVDSATRPAKARSQDSEGYSCVFDDDCTARPAADSRQPTSSAGQIPTRIGGSMPLLSAEEDNVAEMTQGSLQMISMLELSSGTIRSKESAVNTACATHGHSTVDIDLIDKLGSATAVGVEGGTREIGPIQASLDTSLTFSLSSSHVNIKGSTEAGSGEAASIQVPQAAAPVGIAFTPKVDLYPSVAAPTLAHTIHTDMMPSSDDGESDADSAVREALMTESLDIDWTFVKSPSDRGDHFSPPRAVSATPTGSSPAIPRHTDGTKHSRAASRYDLLSSSGQSDNCTEEREAGGRIRQSEAKAHISFESIGRWNLSKHGTIGSSTTKNMRAERDAKSESTRKKERVSTYRSISHNDSRSRIKSKTRENMRAQVHERHYKRSSWPPPTRHRRHRSHHSVSPPGRSGYNPHRYDDFYAFPYTPFGMPYHFPLPHPFMHPYYYGPTQAHRRHHMQPHFHQSHHEQHQSEGGDIREIYSSSSSSASSELTEEDGVASGWQEDKEMCAPNSGKQSVRSRQNREYDGSISNRRTSSEDSCYSSDHKRSRRRHRRLYRSPKSSERYRALPEVIKREFAKTFPLPRRSSRAEDISPPFSTTISGRFNGDDHRVGSGTKPSYHIPPPVQSPSFTALERDRKIRLYLNGKYDQRTSLHTLVNTFKRTYETYSSPFSKSASPSNEFWLRKATAYKSNS